MKSPLSFAFLLVLATLLAARVAVAAGADALPPRPNLLYVYVDDLGWGSIGPNGQAERRSRGLPTVRTPNLDRLAAEGVNFTRGYGCHVCSPARSSQQSGFHQGHTFADRNDPDNAKKAMRADEVLIGDALSAAGYATGYWGKWGYGGSKDLRDPEIVNVQTLPTRHGYQDVLAELHHVRAHTFFQPTLWRSSAGRGVVGGLELVPNSLARYRRSPAYPRTPALQNHSDYPVTAYCDDAYAFAALDFVRHRAQHSRTTGQPFFGLLAAQIPHAPFDEITQLPEWDRGYAADPRFAQLSDQARQWAAMVTRIDSHLGNLLDALEDPNGDGDKSDSVAQQTLIVFQSDNGGPRGRSRVELASNGGLRGSKGQIDEGGIRVPLVMRWPAMIHQASPLKAGTDCDRVVDVSDLLPTFCELAGAEIPLGVDGVSLAPTLTGRGRQRPREFIIHEAGKDASIIRGDHKLIRKAGRRGKQARLEFYDLAEDPTESRNLAAEHPELVRELETLLLGERVTEPKGFAVTYHHWIGDQADRTSDPDAWSDYVYENAGIEYLTDHGGPRPSWIASMENQTTNAERVVADQDLNVLAFSVQGNAESKGVQTLVLPDGIRLNGRNEIRVGPAGRIRLNGGRLTSLRWVEIQTGGALAGRGAIEATVYQRGRVRVTGGHAAPLRVAGDYYQFSEGELELPLRDASMAPLQIAGKAVLDGTISLQISGDFQAQPGQRFTLVSAEAIEGRFSRGGGSLVTERGHRFRLQVSGTALTAEYRGREEGVTRDISGAVK